MDHFLGEFLGTMVLIVMGCGVVANVVLNQTKGQNSGWIVITFGWAMAAYLGIITAQYFGGSGHINPAVTMALVLFHDLDPNLLLPYATAQITGAILGGFIIWIAYKQHLDSTDNKDLIRAVFCTSPAIRNPSFNFLTETIGTFMLVFCGMCISPPNDTLGSISALPFGLLVLAVGLSLGGPTGYAINPARDLGPRIAHFILPIRTKGHSDWSYSMIPVIAPLIGACLAVILINSL